MNSCTIKTGVALSASWISTAGLAYIAYEYLEPHPRLSIDCFPDANGAIVNVLSTSHLPLREVKVTHKNLDCLRDKGYMLRQAWPQSQAPILIENTKNRYSIADDCAACRVATEVEYKSFTGLRKELLEWAPAANHELLKVHLLKEKPHPVHKQQNHPEECH